MLKSSYRYIRKTSRMLKSISKDKYTKTDLSDFGSSLSQSIVERVDVQESCDFECEGGNKCADITRMRCELPVNHMDEWLDVGNFMMEV